jgi:hypothetical protein
MCVPFPLLGSMLHTPMLAFGYFCYTFSTHVVTLTIISSVTFLYGVTSFVPRFNTTLSTFSLSTCESDLSNSFWTWSNLVRDTEMLYTLGFSKRSLVQLDAPR